MKRFLRTIAFITFLFLGNLIAQSYHTITIDGDKDPSWNSVETFTDVSHDGYTGTATKEAYLTWDADYIYFAIQDDEADYDNMATFMYFDVDNSCGTTDAYAWEENITTPFACDYVVVWKNQSSGNYIEVMHWDGSSWQKVASANSTSLNNGDYVVNFGVTNGNDYREVKVKRSTIGNPGEFKFCTFTEQQWGNNWRYFAFPSEGWTDANRASGQEIQHYRGYALDSGRDPNDEDAKDRILGTNKAYLSFDGTNDYVKYYDDDTLGKLDGATNYTLEAWIYPIDGTVEKYDRVFQRYYSFAIVMCDDNNDGQVEDWYFQINDGSDWKYYKTEGDATLTLNAWNHLAVINNSSDGTLKLFVNGTDVTQTGGYSNISMRASVSNDHFYVGAEKASAYYNSFGGYIDEVRMLNVAVNPAELHSSKNNYNYTSNDNTAVLFHFDEGTGTNTLNKASGNNATLNNGTTWQSDVSGLPLPIELVYFTAKVNENNVLLKWQTATEVNNYGFEIERSTEKVGWNKIGFVEGNGTSNSPKEYSFTDDVSQSGKYSYRLKQIDIDGSYKYSNVVEVNVGSPEKFELKANYPNPFNPTTTIEYSIPNVRAKDFSPVQLIIYDVLGRKIATLVNKKQSPGNYSVNFNASNLTSGIYFYTLRAGNFTATRKMILIK